MFKEHPIYGEYFLISENGEILSKRTNKLLKTQINDNGYVAFSTRIGGRTGKSFCFRVHRLVAETWIENPENKPEVNHKDGDKLNNHSSNLEWATRVENANHAYNTGLVIQKKGYESPLSKFSEEDIKEIRENKNKLSCRKLSKIYGVHYRTISLILQNKIY